MNRLLAAAAATAITFGSTAANAGVPTRTVSVAASTVVPAGWASSGTTALSFARTGDLGALSAGHLLNISVGLAMQNRAAANAEMKAIYTPGNAAYHHFVTPAQFAAEYGPSKAVANAMASYLVQNGFKNVTIAPNRLLVSGTATAASVSRAFDTQLHVTQALGHAVFGNVTPALVPAAFKGLVVGVLGLNNLQQTTYHVFGNAKVQALLHARSLSSKSKTFAQAKSTFTCSGTAIGPLCSGASLTPNELRVAYNDQGSPLASNTNVGVFTFGGIDGLENDLRIMETRNGLRQVPFNVVYVNGGPTAGVADPEWDLDTQSSTGVAGDVKSLTVFNSADGSDAGSTVMYNTWVTQDLVQAVSASYGECEVFAYEDGAMHLDDQIFFEGAMQGQSMFNSTGDTGASCDNPFLPAPPVLGSYNGTPVGLTGLVSYPSSSPWVVAVGGTDLLVNSTDGTYETETGWQTGGGGMSLFEIFFEYQTTPYAQANRMVPDIAMTADPNVGDAMDTIVAGADEGVGGTSLSSPLSMGVFARLLSHHNNTLGNALEDFYSSYSAWGGYGPLSSTQELFPIPAAGTTYTQVVGFKDILIGNNVGYSCLPGYDMVTGLGSLDINGQIVGWGS